MNPTETPTPSSGGGSQKKVISPINADAVRTYLAENPAPRPEVPGSIGAAQTAALASAATAQAATPAASVPVAAPAASPTLVPAQQTSVPTTQPQQAPSVAQPEIDVSKWGKRSVANRVQSLQIYSFLIIVYGVYTLYAGFRTYLAIRSISSGSGGFSSLGSSLALMMYMALIIPFVYLGVGLYLLLAKNIRTVSTVLAVLLVLGGLGLLNTITAFIRYSSHTTASSIIGLVVTIGLLVYLYIVRTNVEFVRQNEKE